MSLRPRIGGSIVVAIDIATPEEEALMSETDYAAAVETPKHLWIVGGVSLLWNAVGAFDYLMTQTQNESYMAQFTPEQLEFFYSFPMWVTAFWALAVWGSVLGSALLLMRKSMAVLAFKVSLASMVMTAFHNYVLSDAMEVVGTTGLIFTVAIFAIAVGLLVYSKAIRDRGVLA